VRGCRVIDMSTHVLARLSELRRISESERAGLFFYYRREMRWGSLRACYYAAPGCFHDPLTLVRKGF
jgi:hypothetical protein